MEKRTVIILCVLVVIAAVTYYAVASRVPTPVAKIARNSRHLIALAYCSNESHNQDLAYGTPDIATPSGVIEITVNFYSGSPSANNNPNDKNWISEAVTWYDTSDPAAISDGGSVIYWFAVSPPGNGQPEPPATQCVVSASIVQ